MIPMVMFMNKVLTTILDIGEEMLLCGAEVSRVEGALKLMGRALGASRVDAFIITSSMVVTLHAEGQDALTQTRRVESIGTDIGRLHRLNDLARRVAKGKLSCDEAEAELKEVLNQKRYPFGFEIVSYAFISGAFTLFFGGGLAEAACSFIIGAVLSLVVSFTAKTGVNKIFARLISSFVATILAFGFLHIGAAEGVDNIIIGNIMTLIPGVGLTTALRDLFVGDSITGLLRTIEAALFALAIAGGYFLSAFISGDVAGGMSGGDANPILQVATGFVGSIGFAVLYNIRGSRFIFASLGGLFSWSAFLALAPLMQNEVARYFVVAALISLYAEIMARVLKTPTTTFIITSLIPLIPGSSLYYTMTHAFLGQAEGFLERGITTLSLSGALAAGIIIVAGFAKIAKKHFPNSQTVH